MRDKTDAGDKMGGVREKKWGKTKRWVPILVLNPRPSHANPNHPPPTYPLAAF